MDHHEVNLHNFLVQTKDNILAKWFHLLLEEYPAETARLFQNKNQFHNPVGHSFYEGISGIYEELLRDKATEELTTSLDKIIRIKAVQDVSPSQGIEFLFKLKKVVREEVSDRKNQVKISFQELLNFESRIDDVALIAFTIYTECREKVYQLRINEVKKRCEILERVNEVNKN